MEDLCHVCEKILDQCNLAQCQLCGRRFHLAWSVDAETQNCGHVWFDRRSCGMAFACKCCVDENPALRELIVETQQTPPADNR